MIKDANDCPLFDENRQQALLNNFWALAYNKARKMYLSEIIVPVEIKRHRSTTNKRTISRHYYLKDSVKHRMCLQFILDTLCIGQTFVKSVKIQDLFSVNTLCFSRYPKINYCVY